MMKAIIQKLRNSRPVNQFVKPVYFCYIRFVTWIRIKLDISKLRKLDDSKRIYLLGIPTAANLGDMTQYLLILEWLKKNYPEYDVADFPSRSILYRNCFFMDVLEEKLKPEDYIFFQSGYDTHDLGGEEDFMHKMVIPRFPEQKMVMMPQTVYFRSKERERDSLQTHTPGIRECCFLPGIMFLIRRRCRCFRI